ncbi:MAG: ATP-binding protein, partial [Acidobacteriota bacterium]
AQKMEAIGQLAGGVAHDFNNLLTGIIGYSDLLMKKLGPDHPLLKQAGQIKKAGDQAAVLTGQLLAFSRKQVLQPQVVDLNEIVTGIDEMLRRSVGDNITLVTSLSPALGKTKADPSQIEQVILNLVSNACDAMPDGGTLTIATENIERKQANGYPGSETIAKRHVMLTVSDTGCGMDRGTLAHIFEPFFTTKEVGKGTGLGLASVYGVVQQSGGHIQVSSESGRGTKFQIYLSQVDKTLPSPKPDAIQPVPSGGWETILLVEDSDPVRELLFQCLQDEGYTVLAASQSAEAIQIAEKKQQKIDMLLTDVIMPGMSGPDLAQIILKDHKDIKVLYLSGYSDHPLVLQGTSKPKISFLAKPFTLEALLHKVREVFDASKSRPPERNSPAKVKAKTTQSPKPAKATRGRPKSKS